MKIEIEIEPKTAEYYIATVDKNKYVWTFHQEPTGPQYDTWFKIDEWCTQTFGEQGMWGGPNSAWKRMGPSYYFQTNEDRAYFVLGMA